MMRSCALGAIGAALLIETSGGPSLALPDFPFTRGTCYLKIIIGGLSLLGHHLPTGLTGFFIVHVGLQ